MVSERAAGQFILRQCRYLLRYARRQCRHFRVDSVLYLQNRFALCIQERSVAGRCAYTWKHYHRL